MKRFKIFAGTYGQELLQRICSDTIMNIQPGRCLVSAFSDGEAQIEYQEEVRGEEVYIVQPLVNSHAIIELCLMIDSACRSSADKVIAVVPYYAYARQERKVKPRVPISAKWLADTIINSGASRILTIDLHAGAIQGFVDARHPFDNLYAGMAIMDYLEKLYKEKNLHFQKDTFSIAPDNGSADRVRALSDRCGIPERVIIDKRRATPNQSKALNIIGKVPQSKRGILIDDIIDTAGSVIEAVNIVCENGASRVDVGATHGILSGPAIERLQNNDKIETIIITDSYPFPEAKYFPKLKIISVASMLAQAIKHINREMSFQVLFERNPPFSIVKE